MNDKPLCSFEGSNQLRDAVASYRAGKLEAVGMDTNI